MGAKWRHQHGDQLPIFIRTTPEIQNIFIRMRPHTVYKGLSYIRWVNSSFVNIWIYCHRFERMVPFICIKSNRLLRLRELSYSPKGWTPTPIQFLALLYHYQLEIVLAGDPFKSGTRGRIDNIIVFHRKWFFCKIVPYILFVPNNPLLVLVIFISHWYQI